MALVAEEAAGLQALRLLADRGHRIVAVFTGSGQGGPGASVAALATTLGIPVRPAEEVRDPALGGWLRAQGTDLLLNVHSLHLIDSEVLEAPGLGAFNLHPGPLPERAGLNAPSWALYEGAESHGVTLHRMEAAIDEGAIAFSDSFAVGPSDSALAVFMNCVRRGLPLVERLLGVASSGKPIPAQTQDHSRWHWFGAGPPQDGCLEWDRPTRAILDFVRACDYGPFRSPWPAPRCISGGREIGIAAAEAASGEMDVPPGTVGAADGDAVRVAAADGWIRVLRVESGGRTLPAVDSLQTGERLQAATAGRA